MQRIAAPGHRQAASHLRKLLAKHKEIEFLVRVGEYQRGADPQADEALAKIDAINQFLKQDPDEHSSFQETVGRLIQIAGFTG